MVPGTTLTKPVQSLPPHITSTNPPIRRLAENIQLHLDSASGLSYLFYLPKCTKISLKDNKNKAS